MDGLTAFQRDILYVIAGLGTPKGLAIKDELEQYYETGIDRGQLYPNLDNLVDRGLINKSQQDKRTNAYALTERGQQEIETRREWETEYTSFED